MKEFRKRRKSEKVGNQKKLEVGKSKTLEKKIYKQPTDQRINKIYNQHKLGYGLHPRAQVLFLSDKEANLFILIDGLIGAW